MKIHTKQSIIALLNRNDKAVIRGLRVVKSICGYCFGGYWFANNLLKQLDEGKQLTPYQMRSARNLLKNYAAVLAYRANQLEKERYDKEIEEWKAEVEAERDYERYLETQAELAYIYHGYDLLD